MLRDLAVALCLLLIQARGFAATYYVDYLSGGDGNSGLTSERPFKHAPGDPSAVERAAAVSLLPGDTVRFKGGVVYQGSIDVTSSGTPGKRISYIGNHDGAWGTGAAILDGSSAVASPSSCIIKGVGAAYCFPYKANSERADLFIYTSTGLLPNIQFPRPKDSLFVDELQDFLVAPLDEFSEDWVVLPKELQLEGVEVRGGYIRLHGYGNKIYLGKITGFDPRSRKLSFSAEWKPYKDRALHYSIFNLPIGVDQGDGYVYDNSLGRVIVFTSFKKSHELYLPERRYGILVKSSHIQVSSLIFRRFVGEVDDLHGGIAIRVYCAKAAPCSDIVIKDNVILENHSLRLRGALQVQWAEDVMIQGNRVENNFPNRSILVMNSRNVEVSGNKVFRSGGTGLALFAVDGANVHGNEIGDAKGVHANGVSFYVGSSEIYFCNNLVVGQNIGLTTKESQRIRIVGNRIFSTGSAPAYADWGKGSEIDFKGNFVMAAGKVGVYANHTTEINVADNLIVGASGNMKLGGNNDVVEMPSEIVAEKIENNARESWSKILPAQFYSKHQAAVSGRFDCSAAR